MRDWQNMQDNHPQNNCHIGGERDGRPSLSTARTVLQIANKKGESVRDSNDVGCTPKCCKECTQLEVPKAKPRGDQKKGDSPHERASSGRKALAGQIRDRRITKS